jgi:hypothetical protein
MRESAIQSAIVKKLKKAGFLVNTNIAPIGWMDIRAFGPDGRVILIEVKRLGLKPSEIQEIFIQKFKDLGFEVYVMDNTKEIDKIINLSS